MQKFIVLFCFFWLHKRLWCSHESRFLRQMGNIFGLYATQYQLRTLGQSATMPEPASSSLMGSTWSLDDFNLWHCLSIINPSRYLVCLVHFVAVWLFALHRIYLSFFWCRVSDLINCSLAGTTVCKLITHSDNRLRQFQQMRLIVFSFAETPRGVFLFSCFVFLRTVREVRCGLPPVGGGRRLAEATCIMLHAKGRKSNDLTDC